MKIKIGVTILDLVKHVIDKLADLEFDMPDNHMHLENNL